MTLKRKGTDCIFAVSQSQLFLYHVQENSCEILPIRDFGNGNAQCKCKLVNIRWISTWMGYPHMPCFWPYAQTYSVLAMHFILALILDSVNDFPKLFFSYKVRLPPGTPHTLHGCNIQCVH